MNLSETIHDISLEHCQNGGLILGQCLSSVGRVNGTVPDHPNVIELPMTDVAGSGFACGMALAGRKPIFIMRFQDFSILNGSSLINYAAKVKELHGIGCPVFIRAIASEGLGPVHSSVLHSVFCHFPGFRVVAPTTPSEYQFIWDQFLENDKPYYVSEHRDTYRNIGNSFCNQKDPDIIIMAIKSSRILEEDNINANVWPITTLKPFKLVSGDWKAIEKCGLVLVVDPSYEYCSIATEIAYRLMQNGAYAETLTSYDATKLLKEPFKNEYPKFDVIYRKALSMVRGKDIGVRGRMSP
jgi:pyruvate dehydrogenase E1 component beta subunit